MFKPYNIKNSMILILVMGMLITSVSWAQTRSRIKGRIMDAQTGEGLAGASVMIVNTNMGAAANLDGEFVIINVPVGKYTLKAMMIGYETQIITDLMVSLNRDATVTIKLNPTDLQGEEVVVLAKRNELHKEVSNTQMVVSDAQLQEATGIREINAFLTKLPGISEENGYLSIRGGTADQTGMMINGLSYMNAAVGNAETSIPLSAVEQVSLLSGGYNAEYGNFRSGLINVTTKSGTQDGYHGTFEYSRNTAHQKRFGPSMYEYDSPFLRPILDADVAFVGTDEAWGDDSYMTEQHFPFLGWNYLSEIYNVGKEPEEMVSPLDYYLFAAWMHMAEPDYEGLKKLGYTVSEEQKRLFADHRMDEEGMDWNFDGGFGGPVPLVGKYLGNATFYISNNTKEQFYVQPVTLRSQKLSTTLATIKSQPTSNLTLTFNGLYKDQRGVSPIRPPRGDIPSADKQGGFMPLNNIRYLHRDQGVDADYTYDQPLYPILNQSTMMGGLTVNHVLSPSTFWELSLSALQIKNNSETGNTRDNTVITHFGPIAVSEMPYGKFLDGGDYILDGWKHISYDGIPGITFRRFRRKEGDLYDNTKVSQYRAKFEVTSQLNMHHYAKAGIEYNYFDLDHNHWQMWNENFYNVYEFNYHRKPSQTGVFIQDQISYAQIIANLGVRFDYYYGGGGKWPTGDPYAIDAFRKQSVVDDSAMFEYLQAGNSYIWDVWEAYDKENPGFLQDVKNYYSISPRIGISFPITINSKFYFNYGHFRSNPPYSSMFLYRYRYDKEGLNDMANPNLEPPRTISYELGTAINVLDNYVVKLSGYSKDVSGEQGEVTYQATNPGEGQDLDYDGWVNNQYEDIQGFEVNISKVDNSWFNGWLNFNYMFKKSGLTGREYYTNTNVNEDQEGLYADQATRSLPIPELNASLTFRSPKKWGESKLGTSLLGDWNLTFFTQWRDGGYFTWNPLNELHVIDNMKWPDYYMIDMKLSKTFKVGWVSTTFFVDASNIFNIKNSLLHRGWAFKYVSGTDLEDRDDFVKYMASLHLPEYNDARYDAFRESHPGEYLGGDDKIGDLRSDDKPYINDPNNTYWLYGEPRDIWFGLRFNF